MCTNVKASKPSKDKKIDAFSFFIFLFSSCYTGGVIISFTPFWVVSTDGDLEP